MNRYSAFLIHLSISLIIFAVLAAILLYWWYPLPFFDTDGGWQGIRIIALVDLVLGPCLTLIVFRPGKPGLAFDLTAIGIFQAVCLAAGVWIVHSERPLAMVMVDDIFYTISSDDYLEAKVPIPDLSRFEGTGPKWVTVDLPDDVDMQADIRKQSLVAERPLRVLHERYIPFSVVQLDPDRAVSEDALLNRDRETQAIPEWLEEHGGTLSDYRFYVFGARYQLIHLGIRKDSGAIAGVLRTPAPL